MPNPYNQYIDNQVMTATPGKLLVLTFDTAIRFGRNALESMKARDLYEQSQNIKKVQNILIELICALNHEVDPALTANLESIYTYCFNRLSHATMKDDQEALSEVIQIMTDLRSAWAEAELAIRAGEGNNERGAQAA